MVRRCVVHILLSLLLLVSQQMAFAHAMSHWTGQIGSANPLAVLAQDVAERDLSSSVAQDGSCNQCLAFAQLASSIAGAPRQFVLLDLQDERVDALSTATAALRTVCVFHSRAPPFLV